MATRRVRAEDSFKAESYKRAKRLQLVIENQKFDLSLKNNTVFFPEHVKNQVFSLAISKLIALNGAYVQVEEDSPFESEVFDGWYASAHHFGRIRNDGRNGIIRLEPRGILITEDTATENLLIFESYGQKAIEDNIEKIGAMINSCIDSGVHIKAIGLAVRLFIEEENKLAGKRN